MDDFHVWRKPRHHAMVELRQSDNYSRIWISLRGVNIEQPCTKIKGNGDCVHDLSFYDILAEGIVHESVHKAIINLSDNETSARYDNLYHFKGAWWLP